MGGGDNQMAVQMRGPQTRGGGCVNKHACKTRRQALTRAPIFYEGIPDQRLLLKFFGHHSHQDPAEKERTVYHMNMANPHTLGTFSYP